MTSQNNFFASYMVYTLVILAGRHQILMILNMTEVSKGFDKGVSLHLDTGYFPTSLKKHRILRTHDISEIGCASVIK